MLENFNDGQSALIRAFDNFTLEAIPDRSLVKRLSLKLYGVFALCWSGDIGAHLVNFQLYSDD